MHKPILVIALATGWVIGPAAAGAAPEWSCLEPALTRELDEKLQYQDALAAMITRERPDLGALAALQAGAIKANFTMRWTRIQWLWETDPARLDHVDAFFSYSWSDQDTADWLAADPDHSTNHARVNKLAAQLRTHPDLSTARDFLREARATEPFLSVRTEFGAAIATHRAAIAACF